MIKDLGKNLREISFLWQKMTPKKNDLDLEIYANMYQNAKNQIKP